MNRKQFGRIGETLACRYIKRLDYAILARNYLTPIGEIDIIAQDGSVLVFIEVKIRRPGGYGLPEEAIDIKKMRKLTRLAQFYIKSKNLYCRQARFDVVSIIADGRFGKKTIKLIKNAFSAKE